MKNYAMSVALAAAVGVAALLVYRSNALLGRKGYAVSAINSGQSAPFVGTGETSDRALGSAVSSADKYHSAAAAAAAAEARKLVEQLTDTQKSLVDTPSKGATAKSGDGRKSAPTAVPPVSLPKPSPPATQTAAFPVDRFLQKLSSGNMALSRPPSMIRGETKIVNLLISPSLGIPELTQQLQAKGDVVEGHAVRIAPLMQAHLSSGAFDITSITAEEQPISATETTEWKWEIKPKEFGELQLHVTVNALVTLDGRQMTRLLRTFDETVVVKVSLTESAVAFLNEHIEWALTGVLVPVIGWLLARWRKAKRNRDNPVPARRRDRPMPAAPLAKTFEKFGRPR